MKNLSLLAGILAFGLNAQGPPITSDNPIMLGARSLTARTLVEVRNTERGTSLYLPIILQYLPTSNTLVAVNLPYLDYDFDPENRGRTLADITLLGKYQFLRKDATGKTFRMVAKTLQTLPTGKDLDLMGLSTGHYAGYFGVVSGYESLKYGFSAEMGYNWMPDGSLDEFRTKLGFGLPLLKPQYPNRQVNIYFEYASSWFAERDSYQLLYAQGIQYAGKNITVDLALQLPLVQQAPQGQAFNYGAFFGTRYTF